MTSRLPSLAFAIFCLLLGPLLFQLVESAPKGHGGRGSASSSSNTNEPSGTFYNVIELNDDYPTNKTLNATEIAALPPFTKTWLSVSDDEDDLDQSSFPNPEYVR
ncbi:hypothetical protein BGZ83_000491 [Gryganskiella cystojenkinii]|nr:hypothetical protein BGZ83_000491 [Gryganskiella cystojenkinii]